MAQFNWEKLGKVFDPSNRFEWMDSYAQVPTPLILKDKIRVYYTCRPKPDHDGKFVSHTSYIDLDINDPSKVLYIHNKPIVDMGEVGSFDEFGIHPTSVLKHDNKVLLYYTGWSRKESVPYQTWIGLLVSSDNGETFQRVSNGPIIGSGLANPYLANGAFVLKKEKGFVMFYASAKSWYQGSGKPEPIYSIKCAESFDGVNWETSNNSILPEAQDNECISRPSVVYLEGEYHMWYAYRSAKEDFRSDSNFSYKIGYANSTDLKNWIRCDRDAGIVCSNYGWDSEMMSYPYVVKLAEDLLMFYNGNGFGKEGFGLARVNNYTNG
ncbi:hypothetical protein OAD50_04225 [Vicingaceae bacterium]|nr:hypothetical protein [Vicingaceae bacterium]